MKSISIFLAASTILVVSEPAMADSAAGSWAVSGNVDGKSFTLDCSFQQLGQNLSGACIDGPTGDAKVQGGRSHVLLEGKNAGDAVSWTYETSYMFLKFDVKYSGVQDGDQIKGTISAAGKTGTFTASRVATKD